jgi:hypothetical protein
MHYIGKKNNVQIIEKERSSVDIPYIKGNAPVIVYGSNYAQNQRSIDKGIFGQGRIKMFAVLPLSAYQKGQGWPEKDCLNICPANSTTSTKDNFLGFIYPNYPILNKMVKEHKRIFINGQYSKNEYGVALTVFMDENLQKKLKVSINENIDTIHKMYKNYEKTSTLYGAIKYNKTLKDYCAYIGNKNVGTVQNIDDIKKFLDVDELPNIISNVQVSIKESSSGGNPYVLAFIYKM